MEDMTIKQAIDRKKQLEVEILASLRKFSNDTGFQVDSVSISHIEVSNKNIKLLNDLSIDILGFAF